MKHKIMVLLLTMLLPLIFGFMGCTRPTEPEPLFSIGEIVKSKLDGRKGMIKSHYYYDEHKYTIRFSTKEQQQISNDSSLYPLISMKQYEIVKVDIDKEKAAQAQIVISISKKDSIISVLNTELADAAKYKAQVTSLITEVEK